MIFCYSEPTKIPIEYWTIRAIRWAHDHDIGGDDPYFACALARKLYAQIEGCDDNHAEVTLDPQDIDQLIIEYYKHEEGSDGNMIERLFDCLGENTVIDLRTVTWEQVQTLGTDPGYRWIDRTIPDAKPWPTIKLKIRCTLILWDGRKTSASWGDYIVKCSEDPLVFGRVGYIVHETRSLDTVSSKRVVAA